ncbi:Sodium-dependent transporter [hydrothermal vent metagenome]|uniref:Sodium-dependent transporter n=1 Tax=hydrothermal vent metagenome TaxID=652676 RepID=A0A3B0VSM1_9ZZZZ
MSPDLLTQVILPVSLFIIMFGMGLSLKIAHFQLVLQAPKAIAIGLFAQMALLPLLAFLIAILFSLPPEIAVGLMIIALAPGGATSNLFTYLAKGDVSLSISLTAVVSLITPFTLPIMVALSMVYFMGDSTSFSLPIIPTLLQLFAITLLPVALGMWVLAHWQRVAQKIERVLKWFSVLFLLLIIVLIVLKNSAQMGAFFAQAGLATLILNISALFIGYQLAKWTKLPQRQATTIGFEVGIQNGTLALVVAGTLIGNEAMMIPAVTYSILMFFSGGLFGWWLQKRG